MTNRGPRSTSPHRRRVRSFSLALAAIAFAAQGWLLSECELAHRDRVRVHRVASGLRRPGRCLSDPDRGRRRSRWSGRDGRRTGCGRRGDRRVQGHTRRDSASSCWRLGWRSGGVDSWWWRLERRRRRRQDARRPGESGVRRRRRHRRPSRRRRSRTPDRRGRWRFGWRRRRNRRPGRHRWRRRGDSRGRDGLAALGSANPATGRRGGTQTTGGAPGRNASDLAVTATAGSLGVGGDGAVGRASGGGGGGGGLFGGGGGGSSRSFSGGHGGGGLRTRAPLSCPPSRARRSSRRRAAAPRAGSGRCRDDR